jgi:hypothetical protein
MTDIGMRMSSRGLVAKEIGHDVAGLTIAFLVMHMIFGASRRQMYVFGESRVDIAKLDTQRLANEAYPQWALAHVDRTCPTFDQLVEFTDRKARRDPWGNRYVVECRPGKHAPIVVTSGGEDGMRGTSDDISSND